MGEQAGRLAARTHSRGVEAAEAARLEQRAAHLRQQHHQQFSPERETIRTSLGGRQRPVAGAHLVIVDLAHPFDLLLKLVHLSTVGVRNSIGVDLGIAGWDCAY